MRLDTLALRLKVPHCAVDGVAGAPGRHEVTQLFTIDPILDRIAVRFDLGDDVLRIVAQIVDTRRLTAARELPVGELGDNNIRALEGES